MGQEKNSEGSDFNQLGRCNILESIFVAGILR